MDDLTAELRLRGHEPPFETVQEEVDAIRGFIAATEATGQDNPDLTRAIEEILALFSKSKN